MSQGNVWVYLYGIGSANAPKKRLCPKAEDNGHARSVELASMCVCEADVFIFTGMAVSDEIVQMPQNKRDYRNSTIIISQNSGNEACLHTPQQDAKFYCPSAAWQRLLRY